MKQWRWSENYLVWSVLEICSMASGAWLICRLAGVAGDKMVGQSLASSTILLSITVAVVIQLWVRLNDLSALQLRNVDERRRLWTTVRTRIRSLVWLVVFFSIFVFFVLGVTALTATSDFLYSRPLLSGVGAGIGASVALIAGVLVDLNEVAEFRWQFETTDQRIRRRDAAVSELSKEEPGFENDEKLASYKRVSNGP
jgi:hypothetical protein